MPPSPDLADDGRSMHERMRAGDLYVATGPDLTARTQRAQRLCQAYNGTDAADAEARRAILDDLFGALGPDADIRPPFFCDYGAQITAGERLFMNVGCVVLDGAPVVIGDRVLFGPSVQIYTASHPLDPALRADGWELARPITVGDDVWVGGGAILCPGVTIGAGSTVGAGSVVTRDVPPGVFAVGTPCRVIREV